MTVNIYDMAQTWNDGAATFTGIKLNVTDTASASGSLLMDLQVGGVSQLSLDKSGSLKPKSIVGLAAHLVITGSQSITLTRSTPGFYVSNTYCVFPNDREVRFTTSDNPQTTSFVALRSDAANTLAQRNGANAQAFNIYNTYTDASNYERGFMKWNSNVLEIGTEAAGTGSNRSISFLYGPNAKFRIFGSHCDFANYIRPQTAGSVDIGVSSHPWRNIYIRPSASLTPASNGDLCIEATSNTTLTFKYKGSDGTVRSGTVALS